MLLQRVSAHLVGEAILVEEGAQAGTGPGAILVQEETGAGAARVQRQFVVGTWQKQKPSEDGT